MFCVLYLGVKNLISRSFILFFLLIRKSRMTEKLLEKKCIVVYSVCSKCYICAKGEKLLNTCLQKGKLKK